MRIVLALVLIALTASAGTAERLWVNNITVDEYNMTWSYTETFTGMDSLIYRIGLDEEIGNNDSFINAWEILKIDKTMRERLQSSLDKELDVRIKTPYTPYLNTGSGNNGIEVIDVDSTLSPGLIGKTHAVDTIVNRYKVAYRWKKSIFNASTIWFLGQGKSPVTIILPAGIDVINISGMNNVTKNITDHSEITGFFNEISKDRGEITLDLTKNESIKVQVSEVNVTNATLPESKDGTMAEMLSKIRDASILVAGIVIILFIYSFKLKKR